MLQLELALYNGSLIGQYCVPVLWASDGQSHGGLDVLLVEQGEDPVRIEGLKSGIYVLFFVGVYEAHDAPLIQIKPTLILNHNRIFPLTQLPQVQMLINPTNIFYSFAIDNQLFDIPGTTIQPQVLTAPTRSKSDLSQAPEAGLADIDVQTVADRARLD